MLVFRRFALASLAATALVTLAHAQVPAPTLTPPVQPAASAQPADEVAIARQIIDLGFPEERREAMFFATVDQMTMQMRESVLANIEEQDPGAIAILDEWLAEYIADGKTILRSHIPNLMNAWALITTDCRICCSQNRSPVSLLIKRCRLHILLIMKQSAVVSLRRIFLPTGRNALLNFTN